MTRVLVSISSQRQNAHVCINVVITVHTHTQEVYFVTLQLQLIHGLKRNGLLSLIRFPRLEHSVLRPNRETSNQMFCDRGVKSNNLIEHFIGRVPF